MLARAPTTAPKLSGPAGEHLVGEGRELGAPEWGPHRVGLSRSGMVVGRESTSHSTRRRLRGSSLFTHRAYGGARSLPTRLPPQSNEAVGARQWLARLYYGFNRRTWTSRYRQIYNSIQSVRHTQGRCKQGRGPESGCAKWARRGAGGGLAASRALPARLLHGRRLGGGSSPGQGATS